MDDELTEKHQRMFALLTRLNDFEQEWSDLRNELIEAGAFEDGCKTIQRIHDEILGADLAVNDRLNSSE